MGMDELALGRRAEEINPQVERHVIVAAERSSPACFVLVGDEKRPAIVGVRIDPGGMNGLEVHHGAPFRKRSISGHRQGRQSSARRPAKWRAASHRSWSTVT